ncbi:MAG: succinate dehydrogenase, hydrophobic membrane anchor protein [Ferrimicrobium sp.]|uniref:succinate dehydrogenase, hydrophobic membrane anchor protein n=1 Tax=Ferrimicrobium sp. TaxID=2926050 RepID=UPI00261ED1E3|nr:succinate dehydrogenase, hydrophobic membrane anchor protein [Ferrimicrobium sp.]
MAAALTRGQGRGQRSSRQNFETWAWFFMRVSGIILFFLALIHMYIMHIENDVTHTTVSFVARRWANPWWKLFDWWLLVLGLLHGGNGLRTIIDDYVKKPLKRTLTKALLYVVGSGLFLLGTITVLTFK